MPDWLAVELAALSQWPVAAYLRDSSTAYLFANTAHILALGVLIGSIAALDFRILGAFRGIPLASFAPALSRMAAAALLIAAATGFLLFSVRPLTYAQNPAFQVKLVVIGLGVLNALLLRANWRWRAAIGGGPMPASARISAAISLAIWASAVLAGRWIGFLQ